MTGTRHARSVAGGHLYGFPITASNQPHPSLIHTYVRAPSGKSKRELRTQDLGAGRECQRTRAGRRIGAKHEP